MNPYVRTGIIFGSFMALTYSVTGIMSNDDNIGATITGGIIGGALAGALFAFIMYKFTSSKLVANNTSIELKGNEKIRHEGLANHFKGLEGVGGKLYLTNENLIFKSHLLNIQTHTLVIPLGEIISVSKYRPRPGILANGLLVKTRSAEEKFVVNKVDEWLTKIKN